MADYGESVSTTLARELREEALGEGVDPKTSAINRHLQSWDCHNVWVMGASAFPQNLQYNPTGAVGGLAYWALDALRKDYLPNPRPLM